MTENGGFSELQALEKDLAVWKVVKKKASAAPPTTDACKAVAAAISGADDHFFKTNDAPNPYHAGAATAEGGCCVVV